jgi:hypothetical protein
MAKYFIYARKSEDDNFTNNEKLAQRVSLKQQIQICKKWIGLQNVVKNVEIYDFNQ